MARKNIGIALALMLMVNLAFSIGINQDFPSKVTMIPGESSVYGIRITNPSESCVGVKISDIGDDNAISKIMNKQDIYYILPNSSQKIFLNVSIPESTYRGSYVIRHSFTEIAKSNSATVIDVSLGAKSAITISVGTSSNMQKHTQKEIDEVLGAKPVLCNLTAENQIAEQKFTEKVALEKASEQAKIEESKKNGSIIDNLAATLSNDKPKAAAGLLAVADKESEDQEFAVMVAAVLFAAGALAIISAVLFKKFIKKNDEISATNDVI